MLLLCDLDYIYVLTLISNCAANIYENSKLPWNTVHYLLKIQICEPCMVLTAFWKQKSSIQHKGWYELHHSLTVQECKEFHICNPPFHRKYKENILYVENILYGNYLSFFKVDVM